MKCDLHVHTAYSYDSASSPKEMVDAALKKGVDCLAITDHGEIKGAREAIEYAKGKPILIIPGIEIKSKEGDVLGLNVKEIISNGLSAEEAIKKIREAGGRAIIPHPFAKFRSFKGNLKEILETADGVEVLNASIFGPSNKKALEFAQKYNLSFTAGSDAHFPDLVGRTYLEIPGEGLSIEIILEKIKNKEAEPRGEEISFLETIIDHLKRSLIKIKNYAFRKPRKI